MVENRRAEDNGNSEWTKGALYKHLITLIDANDRRYTDRFRGLEEDLRNSSREQKEYTNTLVNAQEKAITVAMTSADKAVSKAELATEKRLEGMNEFRGQMADQVRTYMPRIETELLIKNLDSKICDFNKSLSGRLKEVEDNQKLNAGSKTGGESAWKNIVLFLAVIGSVIAIILNFVR